MSRKCLLLVMLLVLVVAVSGAQAQFRFGTSARYMAMGNTGIAFADDAAAVDFNGANLGIMDIRPGGIPAKYWDPPTDTSDRKIISGQVIATGSIEGGLNLAGGYAGFRDVDEIHKKLGIVVAWKSFNDFSEPGLGGQPAEANLITLGYGHQYYYERFCWGGSYVHDEVNFPGYVYGAAKPSVTAPVYANEETRNSLNGGVLWWFPQTCGKGPIRAGAVIQDILGNNVGPLLNVGVSVPVLTTLTVAADYNDVFGTSGSLLDAGLEWRATPDWRVRLGDANIGHQQGVKDAVTAGIGWDHNKYKVDVAFVAPPGDTGLDQQWVASSSYDF